MDATALSFLRRRARAKSMGFVLLAVMLFAQMALAAQSCVVPVANASMAYAETGAPCHDEVSASAKNACLAHCKAAYQAPDHMVQNVGPTPTDEIVLLLPPPAAPTPAWTAARQVASLWYAGDPPLAILLQKFRN